MNNPEQPRDVVPDGCIPVSPIEEALDQVSLPDFRDDVYRAGKLAGFIKQRRCQLEISQARLAEAAGTHQSVVSGLERGHLQGNSLALIERIAAALDCEFVFKLKPRS